MLMGQLGYFGKKDLQGCDYMAFILDDEGNNLGIVEDYETLKWSRNYLQAGAFQMIINRNSFLANKLQKGNLLLPTEFTGEVDQIYLIEQVESIIDEEGKLNENIILTGRTVGGMMEERLALPPELADYDEREDVAETLMKDWVNENAGDLASIERQIPNLSIAPDQGRGGNVSYAVRYQKLSQILEEIGRAGGLGWEVSYDIQSQESVFDVIEPTDRTKGSGTPVFLDIDFETILELNIIESVLGKKSYAYTGGAGEGQDRIIAETFLNTLEPTGFDRREIFVDAGGLTSLSNIERAGNVELLKRQIDDIIQVNINQFGSFQLGEDWFVGDFITVRNEVWDFEVDLQIIGVTIEIRANEGRPLIDVQIGQEIPTIKSQFELDLGTDERERI